MRAWDPSSVDTILRHAYLKASRYHSIEHSFYSQADKPKIRYLIAVAR